VLSNFNVKGKVDQRSRIFLDTFLNITFFQVMVYDVNTRHVDHISSLASSENSVPPESESGIHAIEINPR